MIGPVIGFGRSAYFVNGANGTVCNSEDDIFLNTTLPIAWSGVANKRVYRHILEHKLDYYYIDTGYFGNIKTKDYKRITKNDLNNFSEIVEIPSNRLDKLVIDCSQYKRGDNILVIPPDLKVLNIQTDKYKFEQDQRFPDLIDEHIIHSLNIYKMIYMQLLFGLVIVQLNQYYMVFLSLIWDQLLLVK